MCRDPVALLTSAAALLCHITKREHQTCFSGLHVHRYFWLYFSVTKRFLGCVSKRWWMDITGFMSRSFTPPPPAGATILCWDSLQLWRGDYQLVLPRHELLWVHFLVGDMRDRQLISYLTLVFYIKPQWWGNMGSSVAGIMLWNSVSLGFTTGRKATPVIQSGGALLRHVVFIYVM